MAGLCIIQGGGVKECLYDKNNSICVGKSGIGVGGFGRGQSCFLFLSSLNIHHNQVFASHPSTLHRIGTIHVFCGSDSFPGQAVEVSQIKRRLGGCFCIVYDLCKRNKLH